MGYNINTQTHTHTRRCAHASARAHTHTHTDVRARARTRAPFCVHACAADSMHVPARAHTDTQTHTHTPCVLHKKQSTHRMGSDESLAVRLEWSFAPCSAAASGAGPGGGGGQPLWGPRAGVDRFTLRALASKGWKLLAGAHLSAIRAKGLSDKGFGFLRHSNIS